RGDLALNTSFEELPKLQKELLRVAKKLKKFTVVATELNDSMEFSPIPLRSECIDIANAVYQGANSLMVSGEVARGKFTFEAIDLMRRVVLQTEKDLL
ncbi:MAG: pyruvate kinase, partial [Candidatus Diapherotrites archaeon]|nr:pyruvate kinase [Candidatus Diapherotrites archaeon]